MKITLSDIAYQSGYAHEEKAKELALFLIFHIICIPSGT